MGDIAGSKKCFSKKAYGMWQVKTKIKLIKILKNYKLNFDILHSNNCY